MDIIEFINVWEMYKIKFVIDGKASWESFGALKDISFSIEQGQSLGIIGENGSGKSTILKLIAGLLKPDRGEIKVSGRVCGLLELGAGFQPELTGRENIHLSAGMFGLTQNLIDEKYQQIVDFAGIGRFIHAPVKCYSQGMFVRLAFAIAIYMQPDILLIDDTLAVGDEYFQRKCIKKIFEIKEQGKTIVFVTHDMNMLKRLCRKALFLKQGRIIKQGLTERVIPLYAQMIGTREGVAILKKGPLNVVFNNGRLFLDWQNKLLTPNSGINVVFLINNKWYSSLQADWKADKQYKNKLVATGKFYQLELIQVWTLELIDDYTLEWSIRIESAQPIEIQEGNVNVMLTCEYARWFSTLDRGEFSIVTDKDKNWQACLQGKAVSRCIGVQSNDSSGADIPCLAFEQSNQLFPTEAQIFNADYLTNCRVLQYKILGLQNYSAIQTNNFNYFSGRIMLNIPDINNYLRGVQDEFVLSSGKLRLALDGGRCMLYYGGINLTKARHMDTSICVNGRWYFSGSARWEINKINEHKIIAKVTWHNLPIIQNWEIEITADNRFSCKIDMVTSQVVDIQEQHLQIACSQDYEYYFTAYGSGNFSDTFLEMETDMLQRGVYEGVVELYSQESLPNLCLELNKGFNNLAKVFNSDFYNKARILRIDKIGPQGKTAFPPGQYPCFNINIVLGKKKEINIDKTKNILGDKKLKFVFDHGRGRIYWNSLELTKKLGLYVSLRSQGRWHDSTSAYWKIERNNSRTIKALGKWLYLPISQHWEIELEEDNLIRLAVSMQINEKINVDRLQTNLMLSEGYSRWMSDKHQGKFPLFRIDIDDDWDRIYSAGHNSRYIGVSESVMNGICLPSITFSPGELNSSHQLNIVNSDMYHCGRVLQYLNAARFQISPGDYSYFNGRINIKV